MIQFNLLPDIKIEHIKSQRMKRLVIVVAVALIGLSVGILVLMFSYSAVQKKHVENLDRDIDSLTAELESNDELTKILSVQNQLNSLPDLYSGRPAADRLTTFIDQTTPAGVGLGRLSIDFSTNSIQFTGTAASLGAVNQHIDTLKFTKFTIDEDTTEQPAFSDVVLTQFGRDDNEANFSISLVFDPQIFDATKDIALKVPNVVTTRAQDQGSDLFDGSTGDADAE